MRNPFEKIQYERQFQAANVLLNCSGGSVLLKPECWNSLTEQQQKEVLAIVGVGSYEEAYKKVNQTLYLAAKEAKLSY